MFAAQASLAIENARLYEEELRREREAAVLLNVGRLLGEDQSDRALSEAARLATLALNAGRGLIALTGGDGRGLALRGLQSAPARARRPRGAARAGRARSPAPDSPPRPARRRERPDRAPARRGGGDTVLGFLYADDPGAEAPSDRVLGLARSVADQMALTLTRERLLAALAREEARYRQLAEGAHDLILSADPSGTVTYANPAATRLLAPLTGPLVGASLLGLATPATRPALQAAWEAAHTQPGGGRAEIEVAGYRLEVRLSAVRPGASSTGSSPSPATCRNSRRSPTRSSGGGRRWRPPPAAPWN